MRVARWGLRMQEKLSSSVETRGPGSQTGTVRNDQAYGRKQEGELELTMV